MTPSTIAASPPFRNILALQRTAGNNAIAGLAERGQLDRWIPAPALQRDGPDAGTATAAPPQVKASFGWDEEGANKSATGELVDGMTRYAIKGLPAPIEQAIVIVPPSLREQLKTNPKLKVDVLVHLHGHGIGWHGRTKKLEKAAGRNLPAAVSENEARDKALDRLEEQLAMVSKDRPMIAILPQGKGYTSGFGGAAFDRVDLVNNVLKGMADLGVPMPEVAGVILSGHSGAGATFAQVLGNEEKAKAKGQHLEELILFDAINGPNELGAANRWIRARLNEDLAELVSLEDEGVEAQKLHLATSPRFRGYCTHGQPNKDNTYFDYFMGTKFKFASVKQTIDGFFGQKDVTELDGDVLKRWKENYTVTNVDAERKVQHEEMMGDSSRFVEALKR